MSIAFGAVYSEEAAISDGSNEWTSFAAVNVTW